MNDFLIVLIVPYGIETLLCNCQFDVKVVLIVPYGIETKKIIIIMMGIRSVNCTLWN